MQQPTKFWSTSGDSLSASAARARPDERARFLLAPAESASERELAPTAEQVAANPEKYAGTSFDPARQIRWPWLNRPVTLPSEEEFAPPGYGLGYGWTPEMYLAHHNSMEPPPGSVPTSQPHVFLTPSGATWIRPGAR
ncbi:MAG: hypothetical protein NZV14_02395 [Bryobacteraceae bacterium]|nr:hypothetical protein [Bryobacteraceae bacterium]MDW8376981.1 hypothetical protein [Bryobacterales bacterium]